MAVKLHTGEGDGSYNPDFVKELVQSVDGTIVECNTAYGGNRTNTAMHMQIAKDHGYTAIADADIMDTDGGMEIPVTGVTHLIWYLSYLHCTLKKRYKCIVVDSINVEDGQRLIVNICLVAEERK